MRARLGTAAHLCKVVFLSSEKKETATEGELESAHVRVSFQSSVHDERTADV